MSNPRVQFIEARRLHDLRLSQLASVALARAAGALSQDDVDEMVVMYAEAANELKRLTFELQARRREFRLRVLP